MADVAERGDISLLVHIVLFIIRLLVLLRLICGGGFFAKRFLRLSTSAWLIGLVGADAPVDEGLGLILEVLVGGKHALF